MNQTTQERKQREAQLFESRRRTAVHEAGHAIVARALGLNVREVTVHGDGSGGICYADIPACDSLEDVKRELSFELAGRLAVELERGNEVRDDALPAIIGSEANLDWPGRSGMEGHRHTVAGLLGDELKAYRWLDTGLPTAAAETTTILIEEWPEVLALAERLLENGTVPLSQERKPSSALPLVDRLKRNRKRNRGTSPNQGELAECVRFVSDERSHAADRSYVRAVLRENRERTR